MELKSKLVYEDYKYKLGEEILFDSHAISLVAAKKDWAAFQILLQGDDEFTVSVRDNAVFSPHGSQDFFDSKKHPVYIRLHAVIDGLPANTVRMYPVGMVDDDDGINKADMLLHNETVFVAYRRIQPVWVEINIPESTVAGLYKGKIHIYCHEMFEDERIIETLYFEIEVKNVVMPKPQDYRFHLDLWQHLSNIARKHEVVLWSDEHFRVIEEYVRTLGDLGQKAVTIIASEIPWSGQGCFRLKGYASDLFEYSMVKVKKCISGNFDYDFSIMDRYIELCFKYGIDKEIEIFGLINIWVFDADGYGKIAPDYPDALRIRYVDETDGCYKFMKSADEIEKYIKALEDHLKKIGVMDKVLVVADEPGNTELFTERIKLLAELAPSFKFKAAIDHAEFIDEFNKQISDFVPTLSCLCEKWELLNKMRDKISGRLLWYVACIPELPNTFICSHLLESRLIGILTAFMELDGFLRWNYTVWPENPRDRIAYRFPNWKAGDTNFVYPANDGRPILSLRYKNLKRGIEDFELIQIVREICPESEKILSDIWNRLLKTSDISEFNPKKAKKREDLFCLEFEEYQKVKALLLEEIQKIKYDL